MRTNEWLKNESYNNQIITNRELNALYPEIKRIDNEGVFQTIMYSFAFTGHHLLSKILFFLYKLMR